MPLLPRQAVLTPRSVEPAAPNAYEAWLGPLRFVTVFDDIAESLGEGLEAVGAVLTAAERRARAFKLSLPVRGDNSEASPYEAGYRLRRQVRQLFENEPWRSHTLFFWFGPDPELQGWMRVGGGDVTPVTGPTFGEWKLDLTDCYLVGRPGQVRPGRRLEVRDLRLPTAARDTRATVYTDDFDDHDLPDQAAVTPGDIQRLTGHARRPLDNSSTAGPTPTTRMLWRTSDLQHGETAHYLPDPDVLTGDSALRDLDSPGSVRIWDITSGIPVPAGYTAEADADPTIGYGWERVYGQPLDPRKPLAIDNGWVRVLPEPGRTRLRIERLGGDARYKVFARLVLEEQMIDIAVLHATAERAVIGYRTANREYRVILQRGWNGPRLEAYYDATSSGAAELLIAPGQEYTTPAQTPSWVKKLSFADGSYLLVAPAQASTTITDVSLDDQDAIEIAAPTAAAPSTVVAQIGLALTGDGLTAADIAAASLADARSIPTLVSV